MGFFLVHYQPQCNHKTQSDVKLLRKENPADEFKTESLILFPEELSEWTQQALKAALEKTVLKQMLKIS